MGQLPKGQIDLIENEDDAKEYRNENKNLAFVTQTTLSVDDTKNIISILKKKISRY